MKFLISPLPTHNPKHVSNKLSLDLQRPNIELTPRNIVTCDFIQKVVTKSEKQRVNTSSSSSSFEAPTPNKYTPSLKSNLRQMQSIISVRDSILGIQSSTTSNGTKKNNSNVLSNEVQPIKKISRFSPSRTDDINSKRKQLIHLENFTPISIYAQKKPAIDFNLEGLQKQNSPIKSNFTDMSKASIIQANYIQASNNVSC